jgi:hypothetical protein
MDKAISSTYASKQDTARRIIEKYLGTEREGVVMSEKPVD